MAGEKRAWGTEGEYPGSGLSCGLKKSSAVGDFFIGTDQHDVVIFVGQAECENFGHEGADLARREIDDRQNLPACQIFCAVVFRDLGRAFLLPDFRAEINYEFDRWLSRLWKKFRADNCADADVNFQELIERNTQGSGGFFAE
jgi:hypothetical protein